LFGSAGTLVLDERRFAPERLFVVAGQSGTPRRFSDKACHFAIPS
jgi:hypothetical protein